MILNYKSNLPKERRESILAAQDPDLVAICRDETEQSEWVCRVFLAQTGDMPPHRDSTTVLGWSGIHDRIFDPFRSSPADLDGESA